MDERVAVDLAGGGEQEARALELGQPERVVGAVGADLERVQRQAQVVDRAGRAGEVVDEVDAPVDLEMLGHVVIEEDEVAVADVLDVLERAGVEVVDADDPHSLGEERFAEMGAEEPGSAGHDGRGHGEIISAFGRGVREWERQRSIGDMKRASAAASVWRAPEPARSRRSWRCSYTDGLLTC